MEEKKELMSVDKIRNRVYNIRGQQVMLDSDLAEIYGYEVKYLNRQVKRNINRFPEDFMFQLTDDEAMMVSRCQNGTLNGKTERGKNVKYNPYVFTEQGIYVVDNYMNTKTLQLLSQKKQGVEVILFTENGHGNKGFLTESIIVDFSNQYPPLRIKRNPDSHDRWIVLDYGLPTEQVYHCGASSKDAGKKVCGINKLENHELIHPVIDKLLLGKDKIGGVYE